MSEPYTQKGRQFALQILDDTDLTETKWKDIGGIQTKSLTIDNPVSDTTSQSTQGDFTDSQFNGYSTVTFNGSGVVDRREDDCISAYKLLSSKAMTGERCARLRLVDEIETIEGLFQITSFEKSGEQQGLVEFTMTAQSARDVSYA